MYMRLKSAQNCQSPTIKRERSIIFNICCFFIFFSPVIVEVNHKSKAETQTGMIHHTRLLCILK